MKPKPPAPPPDPELPEVAVLLGDESSAVLEAAIQEPVVDVRATQVRYDLGRSMTASYSVRLAGVDTPVTLCAYAGRDLPPAAAIVSDGQTRIGVWRFPNDPMLPGLPHAVEPGLLKLLLAEVGVDDPVKLRKTRSYRPRRRAVIEVVTDRHRLFVKVVRPSRVADLQGTHTAVAHELRVPRILGWSPELGIAVLEAIPGSTLRHAIASGANALPTARDLSEILGRLPALPGERPGLTERLAVHHQFLTAILPAEAGRLAQMVAEIGSAPEEDLVAAHNDFHSSQVIVAKGKVSGLIDIDTVGRGRRADDCALMLGHLFTLAHTSRPSEAFAGYGKRLVSVFETEVGRTSLRLRTAAAVISFATGPFRAQQLDWPTETSRRLAAAEKWLQEVG